MLLKSNSVVMIQIGIKLACLIGGGGGQIERNHVGPKAWRPK